MDALPEFKLLQPQGLDDVVKARAAHPASRILGGGTDLMVNIRRGVLQALLRALFGPLRTGHINFCGALSPFGKNDDFVGQDFGKSPGDG